MNFIDKLKAWAEITGWLIFVPVCIFLMLPGLILLGGIPYYLLIGLFS